MSTRKHCDICDSVIHETDGGIVSRMSGGPARRDRSSVDLCSSHYEAFKRLYKEWLALERGGMNDLGNLKQTKVGIYA